MVPRYYEIDACNAANYQFFGDWQELQPDQKAVLVAHFILRNLIEGHKNEVVSQEYEKNQPRG